MKKSIITGLLTLWLGVSSINAQVPPGKRNEVRSDKREIRHDRRKLRHNVKEGNTVRAKHNARELRHDKRKLRHDRKNK